MLVNVKGAEGRKRGARFPNPERHATAQRKPHKTLTHHTTLHVVAADISLQEEEEEDEEEEKEEE